MLESIFAWETIVSAIRMATPLTYASLGGVFFRKKWSS